MQYKEGYILDNRYKLDSFIGCGSFGEVWVATDEATDLVIAIKIYISLDEQGLNEFKKEFQLSFALNHSNLLHAYYLGVNPEDRRPYLVMPYCPEGSVTKFASQMSEDELWHFIHDVSAGLAYLHSQQPPIIHQDIKPDNILISTGGEYVITDFGISKQMRQSLRKSAMALNSAGAVSYMGPERFSKQYQAIKASDIWSLGVSIYELATGELPFCGMGGSMQRQGAEIPELPDVYSPYLNEVVQSCLAKETWNRPTAAQLADYTSRYIQGERPAITWKRRAPEPTKTEQAPEQPVTANPTVSIQEVPAVQQPLAQEQPQGTSVAHPGSSRQDPIPGWLWAIVPISGLLIGLLLKLAL